MERLREGFRQQHERFIDWKARTHMLLQLFVPEWLIRVGNDDGFALELRHELIEERAGPVHSWQ